MTGDGSALDNHIDSDMPDTFEGETSDPIFGADGGLVFNWWYSNNGARIAVPGGYKTPFTLPGDTENNDDLHGLGVEFGAETATGQGGDAWWHDAGQLSGDCHGESCLVVGTDHGTALYDGPCWGSYAIYVSDVYTPFYCTETPGTICAISCHPIDSAKRFKIPEREMLENAEVFCNVKCLKMLRFCAT